MLFAPAQKPHLSIPESQGFRCCQQRGDIQWSLVSDELYYPGTLDILKPWCKAHFLSSKSIDPLSVSVCLFGCWHLWFSNLKITYSSPQVKQTFHIFFWNSTQEAEFRLHFMLGSALRLVFQLWEIQHCLSSVLPRRTYFSSQNSTETLRLNLWKAVF